MEISFEHNRLKELREELGISQRELAKQTNIKQANISRWENAKIVPNVLDCWLLAEFFKVSLDYLIGKSEF